LVHVFYTVLSVDVNCFQPTSVDRICEQSGAIENVLGVWNYTMTNAESSYEQGVLFVTKNDNTFDVALKFQNGMLSAQDVVVANGRINFNVNIAGLKRVSFVLLVEGDRIMGESYSNDGSGQIIGTRQLPVR